MFIPWAQPHARYLFLFPIVFGINLIHFFDEKKDGAAGNSIVCFAASIPCHVIWQCEFYEECELFRRVQHFWQRKVWTQRYSRGEKLRCKYLAKKSAKLFANKGAHFWQGKVQNLSPILARQWWRHFRLSLYLSLSLSLSPSAPHVRFCVWLGPGHTAARFGFLYAKRCSFHGYCSKILKLQREARRSEKRPEGQLLALLALQRQKKSAGCSACNVRSEVEVVKSRFFFSFFFFFFLEKRTFSANEDLFE